MMLHTLIYAPQPPCVCWVSLVSLLLASPAASPSLSSDAGPPSAESASGSWSTVEHVAASSWPLLPWPWATAASSFPLESRVREGESVGVRERDTERETERKGVSEWGREWGRKRRKGGGKEEVVRKRVRKEGLHSMYVWHALKFEMNACVQ